MIFIQMYYWSTNQTQTQRAMAAPTIREAQKGVLAAGLIRLLIVIPIVVIPGIVAFKLYGDIGDRTYGRLVGDLLPAWMSGAFAAAMAAAVLTSFNSVLNSTVALYVCDIHENYVSKDIKVGKLSVITSITFVVIAIAMVPLYNNPENSLVETIQSLFGLMSMPILTAFIVGLLFKNVEARAMIAAVLFGICLYGVFKFLWAPFGLHYIHLMFITLVSSITVALSINFLVFGKKPIWDAKTVFGKAPIHNKVS
jgi:SSS family solute:Na+ symporter